MILTILPLSKRGYSAAKVTHLASEQKLKLPPMPDGKHGPVVASSTWGETTDP